MWFTAKYVFSVLIVFINPIVLVNDGYLQSSKETFRYKSMIEETRNMKSRYTSKANGNAGIA